MPPFEKKGACCFSTMTCLSVDQVMSTQSLLSSLLESCQTWYSECLYEVDVPYWLTGHTVKGQDQTSGLRKNDVHSIFFYPFARMFSNLVQWMSLKSRWPYWYSGHMVKGQGQTVGLCKNDVC